MGEACARDKARSVEIEEAFETIPSPIEKGSSATESPRGSLDSDMLSISSGDSDCIPSLDPEDPLTSIINVISHHILDKYKESQGVRSKPQSEHTGKSGPADTSDNSSMSCTTSQSHSMRACRTGKRDRPGGEDEDYDDDGFRKPPRPTKRRAKSPSTPCGKMLACPFWKLDSQAHRPCFHRKIKRISDVKLHLYRIHRLPAMDYCQRCWTAFESEAHKKGHLRDPPSQGCKYNPAARPVGIDNNMAAALHKKSDSSLSTKDQWFAIWDIVFPDKPKPSSTYINDSLSEDATQLQEIILSQWPSVLASIVDEAGRRNVSVDEDNLGQEQLIRATLNQLLDDFLAEQETIRAATLASNYQSPGSRTTSSSNHTDSAIELYSNQLSSQSSSNSRDEVSQLTSTGATTRPLERYSPAPSYSSLLNGIRERPILPSDQGTVNIEYDRQGMRRPSPVQNTELHIMPTPTSSHGVAMTGPANMQTMDNYGANHFFGTELTASSSTPPLTTDDWLQVFQGNGELNGNTSWESTEILSDIIDWSTFGMEGDNSQPQTGTFGGD